MGGRELDCGGFVLDTYYTTHEGGFGWHHVGDHRDFDYRVAADGTATATVTAFSASQPRQSSDDPGRDDVREVLESAIVASPEAAGEMFARHAEHRWWVR